MFRRIKSMKLTTRIVLVTLSVLAFTLTVNYVVFTGRYESSAQTSLIEKAASFTAVADQAKEYVARLNAVGATDFKAMLEDLQQVKAAGKSYRESKLYSAVPVVAGWTTAQEAAKKEHIEFRITSFDARNPVNQPQPGSFSEKLLRNLENQLKSGGSETIHAASSPVLILKPGGSKA